MSEIVNNLSYEEAFTRLEKVLQALESDDLPLEASLELYEQGLTLSTYCTHKLDEAELRVSRWQAGHQTAPFEGWSEG